MSEKEKAEMAEKTEKVEKVNPKVNPKMSPPAEPKEKLEEKQEEEFDKERAMVTIKNLRQIEKEAKKAEAELEKYKAAENERKEAEMSEMEKLQSRAEEAEKKYKKLEIKEQKREIATEVGLPDIFASRIQGETPEDMQADAKALREAMKKDGIKMTNPGVVSPNQETPEAQFSRMFRGGIPRYPGIQEKKE